MCSSLGAALRNANARAAYVVSHRSSLVLLVFAALLAALPACKSDGETKKDDAKAASAKLEPARAEPERTTGGSDLSTLPLRFSRGVWTRIEAPLLSMQVVTKVVVNGHEALATLDTGAMSTVMSVPTAVRLGVLGEFTPGGRKVKAFDAHGHVMEGERLPLAAIQIGEHRWVNTDVLVIGDQPGLFLVGAELLRSVDVLIAADEGLVGLFEAGEGPVLPGMRVVSLQAGDRQLQVTALAKSSGGDDVSFPLIVDTGASATTVPSLVGVNAGLPADLAYENRTLAVGGEQKNRGRFVLDPLALGPERVHTGRVLAMGSTMKGGEGEGLLGNDVMMRHHTLISFARGKMWLAPLPERPSFRTVGPGGASCQRDGGEPVPCISVSLREPDDNVAMPDDAMPDVCLQVDVGAAYAGQTLEMALTATNAQGEQLFNGGALRAYLTVTKEGEHGCFTLWKQLARLGLDAKSALQLRWVRTEGVIWPCDPLRTQCLTFTGPLARLDVR